MHAGRRARAPRRRSSPRRVREVMPIAAIDDIELPAAPGPVTRDARERARAADRAGAGCAGLAPRRTRSLARRRTGSSTYQSTWRDGGERRSCSRFRILHTHVPRSHESSHRHRQPPAVRQGGRGLAPPARGRRARCSSTPASTTTTSSRRSSSTSSSCRGPSTGSSSAAAPTPRRPARMLAALEPLLAAERARRRARLRRHELDAGGRAGRRAGADPGRARRGRDALVRPLDARGAQPRAHRPRAPTCCCAPSAAAGGEPARRAACRARSSSSAT